MSAPGETGSHRLCAEDELEPGECMAIEVAGRTVALANVDGRLHAIDGLCPHRGAALGNGALEGAVLRCPWHGWAFDVTTGEMVMNPDTRLATHPVVVVEGQARIALPVRQSRPLSAPEIPPTGD